MSRKHEGISCDFCHKSGFSLRRYKCLLCFDYDLCGPCFDYKRESNNHHSDHPMQCLLTKYDYGTFYAGEVQTDLAFSYTCPICGQLGHTVNTLKDHLNREHQDSNLEVICPVCASLSEGNANQQTRNLNYHLSNKHGPLITGENSDTSPKVSRRFSKQSRNTTENSVQGGTNRSRRTIQPNVAESCNPITTSGQPYSTGNLFSGHEQGSFGSSDEPLLHTLLNHLYTWRTRRENLSTISKNIASLEGRSLNETNSDANSAVVEGINNQSQQIRREASTNQIGSGLSRSSTIKSSVQDRNKNFRRKLGTRHIIDLTGDNWRLLDPDNDLFSFDDDDLESISLSLNQTSIQGGDIVESEYMDDDEDIASLIPWGQDLGPESIFSQLKAIVDPKSNLSSSNSIFIRTSGGTSSSNSGTNNLTNNCIINISGSDSSDFKLPQNVKSPSSCEMMSDNDKHSITVALDEHLGSQGLFSRDILHLNQQNIDEQNLKVSQKSQFVRDLLLSTFICANDCFSEENEITESVNSNHNYNSNTNKSNNNHSQGNTIVRANGNDDN